MKYHETVKPDQDLYDALSFYTLSHPDADYFIHQHFVDAYAAQNADEDTKPISIIFSLVGLYLLIEKGYTGKQVQLFHMHMAEQKKPWPEIILPQYRGDITIKDVITKSAGEERDQMIKEWCFSILKAYKDVHGTIERMVMSYE
jgi:hypothetical protein